MASKLKSLLLVALLVSAGCGPKAAPASTQQSEPAATASPRPESAAPQFGESRELFGISTPSPFFDIAGFPLLLSVSPDGQRIAYRRPVEGGRFEEVSGLVRVAYEYFVANRDGSDEHMLGTLETVIPWAWSPDGSLLAIAGGEPRLGGALRLGVVDRSGETVQWLVSIAGEPVRISGYQPMGWTPDSRAIYYSRLIPGSPAEFWVVSVDTRERRKILTLPPTELHPLQVMSPWAVLSPDGKYISFLWPAGDLPKQGWWLARADGGGLTLLRGEGPKPGSAFPAFSLSWSPDARGLAYPSFLAATDVARGRPFMGLFYARLEDPSHPVMLTPEGSDEFYGYGPSFSPDSRWAAFSVGGELWMANSQTGERRRLTTQEQGRAGVPFWLYSGDIVYEIQRPQKRAVVLLPALGK